MPSYRVIHSTVSLSCFDVVGQDSIQPTFVGHVGLVECEGSHDTGKVPVLDMGPPLHGQGAGGHIRGDVVAGAELTDDEARKIKTFVDRHANEHLIFQHFNRRQMLQSVPQMYCIIPHVAPLDEGDGRYARTRFSCAGFVLEAYKKARIILINLGSLPTVDMATIEVAYPQTRLIVNGTISAESLGLKGDGPWPVLLCGYLFHSLKRQPNVIRRDPYEPAIADRCFP